MHTWKLALAIAQFTQVCLRKTCEKVFLHLLFDVQICLRSGKFDLARIHWFKFYFEKSNVITCIILIQILVSLLTCLT